MHYLQYLKYQLVLYSVVKVRPFLRRTPGTGAGRTSAHYMRTLPVEVFASLDLIGATQENRPDVQAGLHGLCQGISCVCSSAAAFKLQFLTLPQPQPTDKYVCAAEWLVEPRRFELLTSAVQRRRSPN